MSGDGHQIDHHEIDHHGKLFMNTVLHTVYVSVNKDVHFFVLKNLDLHGFYKIYDLSVV